MQRTLCSVCCFEGLRALPESERPRLIVDADGLNDLARSERWWELLPARTVLTPHPGEMSRLLGGAKVSGGGPDRLEVARNSARAWGHVLVLKGASTLIAAPTAPHSVSIGQGIRHWPPLAPATCSRERSVDCWRRGWSPSTLPAPPSISTAAQACGSANDWATLGCWRVICCPNCHLRCAD